MLDLRKGDQKLVERQTRVSLAFRGGFSGRTDFSEAK